MLGCCVANDNSYMPRACVMDAWLTSVIVLAVVLALLTPAPDVRISTVRATYACPALEANCSILLPGIPGRLSSLARQSSTAYAISYRSMCPTLLDCAFCELELCLRHFVLVSSLKFLILPYTLQHCRPL